MNISEKRAIISYLRAKSAELEQEVVNEIIRNTAGDFKDKIFAVFKELGKVEAIKYYREVNKTGISESKMAVEKILEEKGIHQPKYT